MKPSAAQFHSTIATKFDNLYNTSNAFKERYLIWCKILNMYFKPDNFVLDLGCGSGIFSGFLIENHIRVIGVDGSESMIELCKKKYAYIDNDKLNFICSNIPFDNNILSEYTFDGIIASSVLEYIENIDSVFMAVNSKLKDNGLFIVSFPNKYSLYRLLEKITYSLLSIPAYYKYVRHVITPEYLDNKLKSQGFVRVHLEYYASSLPFIKLFNIFVPKKISNNLFVCVYRKL